MRHFHVLRNREHCPIVNLDKLWSMLPKGTLEEAKAAGGKAPVIDVTDNVRETARVNSIAHARDSIKCGAVDRARLLNEPTNVRC